MKKQYRRYGEYKNSGIEWIGEVPEGWDLKKIKYVTKIFNGATPNSSIKEYWDGDIDWYTPADIDKDKKYLVTPKRTISKMGYDSCGTHLVKASSIIVSNRAPIGLVAMSKKAFCTNQGCKSLEIKKEIIPDYIYYYLTANSNVLDSLGNGTTFKELSSLALGQLQIPLPSKEEQDIIASYLDKKTALLDSIIQKKQEQIALLKEKRTALVNKAVTKGLDDKVEMKDSGVEWIGEIPKGWRVEKLKFASRINKRSLGENTEPDYLLRYVDIGNVTIEGIKSEPEEMIFENAPSRARRMVKAGNTILGTVRTYLKAIAYLEKPESNLIVSTGFAVIESKQNKFENKYLYYLILSEQFVNRVVAYSKGVSYPAINSTELGDLPVFIPPKDEQKKIIEYLERENQRIGYAIGKIEESISLLQEYKTSLISNVVTGKIKVYNFV